MSDTPRKRRHKGLFALRLFFVAVLIILSIMMLGIKWINNPSVQKRVLQFASDHTQWNFTVNKFKWNPFNSKITLKEVSLLHRKNNHLASSSRISVEYSPWSLLRGKIKIRNLKINGLLLQIDNMAAPSKNRQKITLKKLFLLRSLEIVNANISGIRINLPNDYAVTLEALNLKYSPEYISGVELEVGLITPLFTRGSSPLLMADAIKVAGRTSLRNWVNMAPFVNDLRGTVDIASLRWRTLEVRDVAASAYLLNSKVSLQNFKAVINQNSIVANGSVDFISKKSIVSLALPNPVAIPELLNERSFFLTSGKYHGKIDWEGKGLKPEEFTGTAKIDITQESAEHTDIPAQISAEGSWNKGAFSINGASLKIGESSVKVSGNINIPKKKIDINFDGSDIPLNGVLGRFRDPQFHEVTGQAKCSGKFNGWPKDFLLDINAETIGTSNYYKIAIEKARMEMQLTYPKLNLKGEILQNNKVTGTVSMESRYGKPGEDKKRSSILDINFTLDQHDLEKSFIDIPLKGLANGKLHIQGDSKSYKGSGNAELLEGAFSEVVIESITTDLSVAPKTFVFQPSEIKLANVPLIKLPGKLTMDINEGEVHIQGTPTDGANIDVTYNTNESKWDFNKISIATDKTRGAFNLTGTGKSNDWNLHAQGIANAQWLEFIPGSFREADGQLPLDLKINGAVENLSVNGKISLKDNRILLRSFGQEFDDLSGELQFNGRRIDFKNVKGIIGIGNFNMDGWAEHEGTTLPKFDINFEGENIDWVSEDRAIRAEFDANTKISKQSGDKTTIKGSVDVIYATYTRDFDILDRAARREASERRDKLRREAAGYDDIALDLKVRSRGEVWIRNNAAEVGLRAKVQVSGTAANPQLRGSIEATEGDIHYLGLKFGIRGGFVEFHPPYSEPYIDFTGESIISTYLVNLHLVGTVNNLRVELNSVPGESRKNVLCLIAYGNTCDELRQAQFGAKLGPGVFMEQLGKLLERPLSRVTGIDTLRIESAIGSDDVSRLQLGKRVSDRLEISFITSVGDEATQESFEAAYQINDFLLLKTTRSSKNKSSVNFSLRFRER